MKKILLLIALITSLFSFAQNVGIGTTTPQRNLHIVDSSLHPNLTIESPAITLDKDVTIELKQANGAGDWLRLKKYSSVSAETIGGIPLANASTLFSGLDGGDLKIGSLRSTAALDFFAGGQRRMLIQPNGNFGIGTVTSPNSLLEVAGNYNSFPLASLTQFGTEPALKIATSTSTGLELENSVIKVSGVNKSIFQVTAPSPLASLIAIPTTYANSATDMIFITHKGTGSTLPSSVYVRFILGIWYIQMESGATFPGGEEFNVMVIKQ